MTKYVIAKYMRVSIEDAVTESESIHSQNCIIDEHIATLGKDNVETLEFIDNGFTGTSFERPAMQEILEMVQSGGIQCLICKDLSRLGRNALETSYLVDQVFPLYQTRFIAVNDSFDSDDYIGDTGGINIAFKHILHEEYSRDLSGKVKSALRHKMANGEHIVATTIYGYRKNEQGRWEPDEPAARIVRKIFHMANNGLAPARIRDRLFAENLPTPREYQMMRKGQVILPCFLWTARMVTHTLSNVQYTGTYVAGKQISKAIGSHSKIHTDKSEWIIIPDQFPPIVKDALFQCVQKNLEKSRRGKIAKKPRDFLLRGKIACGCCGYALSYDAIFDPVFRCHHTHANPSAECYKMKVNVRELDEMTLCLIKKQLEVVLNCDRVAAVRRADEYDQQIADWEKRMRSGVKRQQEQYELLLENAVSREDFAVMMKELDAQIKQAQQQLALLKSVQRSEQNSRKTFTMAKKLSDESASPRELVETLIEKIHVYPDNRVDIDWKITDFALQ